MSVLSTYHDLNLQVQYELRSFIVLHGGKEKKDRERHYVTVKRLQNEWLLCDDEHVSAMDFYDGQAHTVLMLFYQNYGSLSDSEDADNEPGKLSCVAL